MALLLPLAAILWWKSDFSSPQILRAQLRLPLARLVEMPVPDLSSETAKSMNEAGSSDKDPDVESLRLANLERITGQPVWHPRPSTEWQGMLVNTRQAPPCESSALCGLGRACKDGICTACERSGECAPGEVCVLDHCLVEKLVRCRLTRECEKGHVCILSDYSSLPRGNEGMEALCSNPKGGATHQPRNSEAIAPNDTRTHFTYDDLLKDARQAAKSD